MQKMDKLKCDGGYGLEGNIITEWYLSQLTNTNQEKYRKKLEKENPKKYKEYCEWETWIKK